MKSVMNLNLKKKKLSKRITSLLLIVLMVALMAVPAFCEETTPTPSPSQLKINFNTTDIFSWTQMMIDAYMPVLVITIGIGLAFIIIARLRAVFR